MESDEINIDNFGNKEMEDIGHLTINIIAGYIKSGHVPDRMYARDTKRLIEMIKLMREPKWKVVSRVHERPDNH